MNSKINSDRKKRPGLKISMSESPTPSQLTPPRNLDVRTTLRIGTETLDVQAADMDVLENLGRGAYGTVDRMRHRPTSTVMAVKRIPATLNSDETKRTLMDLDISMRTLDCDYTVQFYGALFQEGDVWICMEVMDISLDKFYQKVFAHNETIPEPILARVAYSVVSALHYLHTQLKVIHRDVKPSNTLCDRQGRVKLCDFGISGYLVDSVAKTIDAGCKPYMAPERINPMGDKSYDIRSDVWSLGISMIEIATGKFPYRIWGTPFEQLKQVVADPAPRLPKEGFNFSVHFEEFVSLCLQKDYRERPNYPTLLQHGFIAGASDMPEGMDTFIARILELPTASDAV
ncbi:dual specificity mitogen-activated protein kinase kinase 6-like [Amphibalanus amphitrite]|uniref:dual specificity mitogen-activated protein kinase kinase 6-like n=1 Tax=Amphibalanus amphitrite TaxID=1232801 RepID=UPI001C917FAD|nr:dual specificity mitogen-activated protein kinase kinase 6-like [Amphibalanus amphitrite]XP_043209368.1 dual specificity mitogen-activated protein kinase kinase 6-like [Amphibalanus amphitrite]XP_043209369.1 dual specificity mitogen-activated protein kinase kinase 6-like [Amphibalanus amphitrite]XP_043209370.1 dual specificity mitogen-activated protein kinase kinase 6-like [Amphibalanus amphitrite]